MNLLLLLHSTTGNTRLVARYAARRFEARGLTCTVHDIVRKPELPSLRGVDLLGVAFPVMYGWPTLAMMRALERLGRPPIAIPAFALATAAGYPFGSLQICLEQLESQGFLPLDAHWVIAPSNYPIQTIPLRRLEALPLLGGLYKRMVPLSSLTFRRFPTTRLLATAYWLDASLPNRTDRDALDRFVDRVTLRARSVVGGARYYPPDLEGLPGDGMVLMTRSFSPESFVGFVVHPVSDPRRCVPCQSCQRACPSGCITLDPVDGRPRFGPGCTGCYACYNACPEGAISAHLCAPGIGRYLGPPPAMRDLFTQRDLSKC